ncbi:MAG TPA: hypothetical protein VGN12_01055 [Pirellulales bacterium]|jgi:hypothetical protein
MAAVATASTATLLIIGRPTLLICTFAFWLLMLLATGWQNVLRTSNRSCNYESDLHWAHVSLLAVVIAASPLLPVVVVAGMHRYAHVQFIPWVPLLKR